jgi:ABC-type branched-subunit amino acid transport system substrate-binding protein
MIDEINKAGGIAGRKIVPIYYGLDATSSQTADQQVQAECAKWTQDNKVFAILAGAFAIQRECARKAGAVEFWSPAGTNSLPETFQQYPHYVEITGLNMVRLGPVTIDGLAQQGYFDKGAKIGIVAWDDPAYREAIDKGFLPALQSHGLRLATDPIYIHAPQNIQDLGATSADVNSAVLKLSTTGVDHVMLLDGPVGVCAGACLGFEFLNRAKSQGYYPRYGFNDNNLPADAQKAGLYPADELKNSVNVAWGDTDAPYDAGWHQNATRERCEALMRKHGVDMSSVNAHVTALAACEELGFLQAVVARLGSAPLTADNFIAAVNALGGGVPSGMTYATNFSPSQHDGIAAVRNMRFVDSCTCYKYSSAPYKPG